MKNSPVERQSRNWYVSAYYNIAGFIKSLPTTGLAPSLLPKKVSLGQQFTGKNPSRPGGRRAERIFAGKLSAGRNFSGGDHITRHRQRAAVSHGVRPSRKTESGGHVSSQSDRQTRPVELSPAISEDQPRHGIVHEGVTRGGRASRTQVFRMQDAADAT